MAAERFFPFVEAADDLELRLDHRRRRVRGDRIERLVAITAFERHLEQPASFNVRERFDFLDEVLPLRISKTPERPLSTQFIPCSTSSLRYLNDYLCRLPWPGLPAFRLARAGIPASSLLKCSPEVKYSQTYASFDGAERYVTALGDLCVCPSPKIRKFDDYPLLLWQLHEAITKLFTLHGAPYLLPYVREGKALILFHLLPWYLLQDGTAAHTA